MELIKYYFPDLAPEKLEKLSAYAELLREWNKKINLVSRKDESNIVERHILHSLSIAKFIAVPEGSEFLDIGSGGGLPGIPLAILFNKCRFTLVDSIRKKADAMNEMSNELALGNIEVIRSRAEQLAYGFHFVLGRAVASLPVFVSIARPLLKKDSRGYLRSGIIYLKGGEFGGELEGISAKVKIYELKEVLREEYFETKKLVHIFWP